MATFQRADSDLEEMVSKVLREHYPKLSSMTKEGKCPLTFDLLMAYGDRDKNGELISAPLKHHGRTAAAVIKAVAKADRALGRADVEIRFDGDHWNDIKADEQEALVDHELYHLVIVQKEGLPARDDLGRFRFKMREHDYEFGWFAEIAKRRGIASCEVQQAKRIWKEAGQYFFGFHETEPLGDILKSTEPQFKIVGQDGIASGPNTLTWEEMDAVQREAAQDVYGKDAAIDGVNLEDNVFVFEGVNCTAMHPAPGGHDGRSEEGAAPSSEPAPAAKPGRKKAAGGGGRKAASRK